MLESHCFFSFLNIDLGKPEIVIFFNDPNTKTGGGQRQLKKKLRLPLHNINLFVNANFRSFLQHHIRPKPGKGFNNK